MVLTKSEHAAPSKDEDTAVSSIQLTVNGVQYNVGPEDASPMLVLLDYLRNDLNLTGPKSECREGGCSACTVVATAPDPENPGSTKTFSILGCRQLLYACNGWDIVTTEGLGDWRHGYHPIQTALAGFYGTQCGFCSPGMVMTMYGQLQGNESLTAAEAEKSLDGNLCRCTGYRPILDAFKSMTVDGDQQLKDKLVDIEDAFKSHCSKSRGGCGGKGEGGCGGGIGAKCQRQAERPQTRVKVMAGGIQWHQPTTLQEVYDVMNSLTSEDTFQLVVGNTAQGVYLHFDSYSVYINTTGVTELYGLQEEATFITIGANTSVQRAIEMFRSTAATKTGFHHLENVADHWGVIGNTSVRNMGSIAGNLMLQHEHPEFYSDIFLTLVGCDAILTVAAAATSTPTTITLEEFLALDMSRSVIISITIPAVSLNTLLRSYKILRRAVNDHAYVNAVFKFEVDPINSFNISSRPVILYGGINPQFLHATKTEDFLMGHSLSESELVVQACKILTTEVVPDAPLLAASPQYRASLAESLLFKAVISMQSAVGITVPSDLTSAGSLIDRPVSSGQQTFNTDQDKYPVGEPVSKVEALPQVAGEADFMNDVARLPGELIGVYFQSTVGRGTIKSIDTTAALAVPGVVTIITAADIPGVNNATAESGVYVDEVFAAGSVVYAGQAIGLAVATSSGAAYNGAYAVVVEYEGVETPTLTIKDAIAEGSVYILGDPITMGNVEDAFTNSEHVLSEEMEMGYQNHFSLELMGARVTPIDDGYDVIATTTWPADAQSSVAQVLGIDANSVNVSVRRIGGSFGQKNNRCNLVVAAAAVAAWKTHQPVRVVMNLSGSLTMIGGREPYYSKYKVGFDSTGKLNGLELDVYADVGCVANDACPGLATSWFLNVYACSNWLLRPWVATTNTPSNTFMRAPGTMEGIMTIETIIDNVASYLGVDPLSVRETNLAPAGAPRPNLPPFGKNVFAEDILPLLKTSASWEERQAEVGSFNMSNRWRKRGIALMPMCFNIGYGGLHYGVMVNLYAHDGTVAISHGGIEIGQGINTKITQIAASIFGIPLEKVKIKATSTTTNANSSHEGATVCSDIVAKGVLMACENIMGRITEFKEKRKKEGKAETSWPELIRLCRDDDVDVCERLWTRVEHLNQDYDVYGGAVVEAEIDVLTGQTQIRRVDIIEDCGQSINPLMDIGQVEGGLVMGLGKLLTEKVKFDPTTGQKLTTGTWEYKIPTAHDIPVDLRVTLLPNSFNDSGVLRAKAVGEPPMILSYGAVMAVREAIMAARSHTPYTGWFRIDTPMTVECVQQLCKVESSQFTTK